MKIIPYYITIKTSSLTNDSFLKRLQSKLEAHRSNNFPDFKGFVGGDVGKDKFELYTTTGGIRSRPSFDVVAFGKVDTHGQWIVKFTCHKSQLLYSALTFLFLIYVSTVFPWIAIPILVGLYIIAMRQFNRDSVILESLVERELRPI